MHLGLGADGISSEEESDHDDAANRGNGTHSRWGIVGCRGLVGESGIGGLGGVSVSFLEYVWLMRK